MKKVNPPLPFTFYGEDLPTALENYKKGIIEIFFDAADVNCTLQIHTIQVIQLEEKKFSVVAFVKEDETVAYREKAESLMATAQKQMGDVGNAACKHEYDESMTCGLCGHQL